MNKVPITIADDGEPRVSDIELAGRLGYSNVSKLRELIRHNEEYLNKVNQLVAPAVSQERPEGDSGADTVYLLTEAQIVFIILISGTPTALQCAVEIAKSFDYIPAPFCWGVRTHA